MEVMYVGEGEHYYRYSSTLFNLYTNDLVDELNALKCRVDIDGRCVSILFYADDVVMSDSEYKLQKND